MSKRDITYRDYVNEEALRAELTLVNLKEEYKKHNQQESVIKFNKRKQERIDEIKELIKNNPNMNSKEKEYYHNEIERLENLTIEKQSKELMGHYVLLITKNLAKKSCFAGYTLNWKDEFFSRAIEHCFKYVHNFDENKVSQRSGQKVKAFAYITQIIYTAFLDVISRRKKEQERLKMMGSLDSVTKGESGYSTIERKSRYKNFILLEFDVLDYDSLKEELESLERFKIVRDEINLLKSELFLLSQYDSEKDDEYIRQEKEMLQTYEKLSDELKRFKDKFKLTSKPEIIHITCNDYGDVKISDVLNMFQADGACCVITKNKTPKAIEKNSLGDF